MPGNVKESETPQKEYTMPDHHNARLEAATAILANPQRTREVVVSAFRAYVILCSADAEGKTPDGDAAVMSARSALHAAIKLDADALRQALSDAGELRATVRAMPKPLPDHAWTDR